MDNCKWCEEKGTHSFGWLDSNGEWHDRHVTCQAHALLSIHQQDISLSYAQMRERSEQFGRTPSYFSLA